MAITSLLSKIEMVIGLEVHIALNTNSKLCCNCSTAYPAPSNSQCCPVCTGMPGSLPLLNEKAIDKTVLAGLVTNCAISPISQMCRKHYFYPDCPKGYQITQGELPLCSNGFITIFEDTPKEKSISISRIHLEEDAGKLLHEKENTFVDFNRSGIPLIEVVSAPVLSTKEEAVAYLKTLRSTMIYAGVTEGKMNEGDMRLDVNISIKAADDTPLSEKCEVKNLNSFQSVADAIEAEYLRQCTLFHQGKPVESYTLGFDQKNKKIFPLRKKEKIQHYRIIPDMDFSLIVLSQKDILTLKATLSPSPHAIYTDLIHKYHLTEYQSKQLIEEKSLVYYFLAAAEYTIYYTSLADFIINYLFPLLSPLPFSIPVHPENFAQLVTFIEEEKITSTTGKKVLSALLKDDVSPKNYISTNNLWQNNNVDYLTALVKQIIAQQPQWVKSYQQGKTALLKSFMGKAMALTHGKGNPNIILKLFETLLEK